MGITQTFYDQLAPEYDKLFSDWHAATREQAVILDNLFKKEGFDTSSSVLDCACGIGTQSIGLAAAGYQVTASDISAGALKEATARAQAQHVAIRFQQASFCALSKTFSQPFDIIIAMDNAIPHMLSHRDLASAVQSITGQLADGGMFVASIRDYDQLLVTKPAYSPPYIHKTDKGQRVSFQTWEWKADRYRLIQYIITDEGAPEISKFTCEYRATTRAELTDLLLSCGCSSVVWQFPEETGFYQPIVIAKK